MKIRKYIAKVTNMRIFYLIVFVFICFNVLSQSNSDQSLQARLNLTPYYCDQFQIRTITLLTGVGICVVIGLNLIRQKRF